MTKIIGSSKDFEKKDEAPLTKDANKPTPSPEKPETAGAEEKSSFVIEGSAAPPESPLSETGLELPPEAEERHEVVDEGMHDDLRLYRAACQAVHRFMTDVAALEINAVTQVARFLITRLRSDEDLIRLAIRDEYIEPFLGAHPVNVAILSVRLADALHLDDTHKLRLVVAALVHDIGMSRMPPDILQNKRDLTQDEANMLRQHPNLGAQIILEQLGTAYEWLAQAVRQEHERVQGQGYPNGLKEDGIDTQALVIGLLDVFEAITHPRRQHAVFNPSRAINQIIASRDQLFSRRIVKALVEAVSVYPVGTYVHLNTGQIGCVIATSPKSPLRPTIEIFTDPARQPLPQPIRIDLRENPVLSILKALDDAEIPEAVSKLPEL